MVDPQKSIETFQSEIYTAAVDLFEGDQKTAENWH